MTEPDLYLVIVVGFNGPSFQLWHGIQTDGSGKTKPNLFLHKLVDDELTMSMDQLKEKFKNELARVSAYN